MPVPDYESLMLPLLLLCGDGKPYTIPDVCAHYCALYETTSSDHVLHGRFGTARNFLVAASLLETPNKKSFQVTKRGKMLLKSPPVRIDCAFLRQYPEFVKAQDSEAAKLSTASAKPVSAVSPAVCASPAKPTITQSDGLAQAYKEHQAQLATELAAQIKLVSPRFFEKLVVDLLFAMGYGCRAENAVQVVGQIGDGGIDGILHEDPLGLSTVYVQAKKRDGGTCIGENEVRNFVGALQRYQPCKGVFVTTGKFTDGAKAYVKTLPCKIALIDGEQLIKYLTDFNVGVSVRQTYHIKKIDTDYFSEE